MLDFFADIRAVFQRLVDLYFLRRRPADETTWHKWYTPTRVLLTNGKRSTPDGQLWRRKARYGYEYQQDEETEEEAFARWTD